MSTKAERRASYENRVDQDGRLTGKHIKTLLHLQDLHSENDLLKARIAELELQQAKAARCDLLERELEKLRVSWCVFLRTLNRYLHNHTDAIRTFRHLLKSGYRILHWLLLVYFGTRIISRYKYCPL